MEIGSGVEGGLTIESNGVFQPPFLLNAAQPQTLHRFQRFCTNSCKVRLVFVVRVMAVYVKLDDLLQQDSGNTMKRHRTYKIRSM